MTRPVTISPLYATLHRWAAEPHCWGVSDCMMALADWVREVRGFDPGEGLRGTYGNPEVCPLGRAYRADPLPVCRRAFAALTEEVIARPGDIALLELPGQRFLMGGLKLASAEWAMRGEARPVLITRAARPRMIWGVGYAP